MKVESRYDLEKDNADSWDDPEFDILQSPGDTALFGEISGHIRALSDIEEIKNDPAYHSSKEIAKEMISGYGKDPVMKIENEKFIRNSLKGETQEDDLMSEISQIKDEANQKGLNDISSEWVREWQEKKQKSANRDTSTQEIRDFIIGSLNPEEPGNEIMRDDKRKSGPANPVYTDISVSPPPLSLVLSFLSGL